MSNFKGFIFDLDGVITDTAKYHYQSWKKVAEEKGLDFDKSKNERMRGMSRRGSLEILLEDESNIIKEKEKLKIMEKKNSYYQKLIKDIDQGDILPGIYQLLSELRDRGYKTAIASASRNAHPVINNLGIEDLFDTISDGNSVENTKPAPDLFLYTARKLSLKPSQCLVFEDAASGIKGAKRAGMTVIGIGPEDRVGEANYICDNVASLKIDHII